MKNPRQPTRDLVRAKDDEEILDNMLDYCMSDDDPELRRLARSRRRSQLSTANNRCDATFRASSIPLGDLIGALATRMVLPAACGPDLGYKKSRSLAQREYLYNQIADDRHVRPYKPESMPVDDHDPRIHNRQKAGPKHKPVRKERKPSGILSDRSEAGDTADDDWDMGVGTARSVWTGKGLKDKAIAEDEDEDEEKTYVIRVRSRESLVSELTELVPGGGFLRKASGTSERALSGEESVGQLGTSLPGRHTVSTKKAMPARGTREGPGKRTPHMRQMQGEYGDSNGVPRFRVFQRGLTDTEHRGEIIDDDMSQSFQVRGISRRNFQRYRQKPYPSPIAEEPSQDEESSLETTEVIQKHAEGNNPLPWTVEGRNISADSSMSAFTPVRRTNATKTQSQNLKKPLLRRSCTTETPDKEMSDKSSQQTNSSASTTRRGNRENSKKKAKSKPENTKCDTTVTSSSSGGVCLNQLERKSDRTNPCIVNTPLLGGLFACARGNRAERLAAEKEEWNQIMVFEPTKRLTEAARHIAKADPKLSPLTIITEETSVEPSQDSPHKVDIRPADDSLLVGQWKTSAVRTKMAATVRNAMVDSKTNAATSRSNFSFADANNTDSRDADEAEHGTGERRELGVPTVTFSYEDEVHTIPASATNDENGKVQNQKKPPLGNNSSFWPFSGSGGLTSELDQLAPLRSPKVKPKSPKRPCRGPRSEWRERSRRSRSPRKNMSPPRIYSQSDTFSEYETDFTSSPSLMHSRADSAFTGSWAQSPDGSVYERKRMASRERYPIFHWQTTLDDTSVGVMSLDY